MEENVCNKPGCTCSAHGQELPPDVKEQEQKHDQGRRDFIRHAGLTGIGLGVLPALPWWLQGKSNAAEMASNPAVRNGKAQRITLLHTTDIHGQLDIHNEFFWENGKAAYHKRGGFATLQTLIRDLRKQNPENTLLLDGGDCFQGSGITALTQGHAMIPLMDKLKYDLMLPGNWEVVYGKAILERNMGEYKAAKVCANMFNSDGTVHESLFPPYQIFHVGGIRIGFVGYNDPLTPIRQSPAYSKGITFTKPEDDLQKYVKILKEEKGCTMVFVISHMGLAQQLNLANEPCAQGVDYILGADTHERIREPLQGKYSKVTEPGAFASFVGKLDIVIEKGKIKDEHYELIDVDPEKYAEDAEMKHLVESIKEPYQKELSRVIGKTKTPLVRYYIIETPMDNLITDAVMWKMKTDFVVSNGFRFCPPLIPDEKTGEAAITKEYLWSMLPVNSQVKTAEVTGRQVLDWLEKELENVFAKDASKRFGGWFIRFQGMQVTFTMKNKKGERVQEVKIQGEKI
ncbi:MAG TPA: bifunctional metallophosphatase/5'-nucleotidase, partial [Bacteroidia bacterium]|nr:bifunctional metallophosphatase/5'-nucleotidase [Bacteroidia bacterium]